MVRVIPVRKWSRQGSAIRWQPELSHLPVSALHWGILERDNIAIEGIEPSSPPDYGGVLSVRRYGIRRRISWRCYMTVASGQTG